MRENYGNLMKLLVFSICSSHKFNVEMYEQGSCRPNLKFTFYSGIFSCIGCCFHHVNHMVANSSFWWPRDVNVEFDKIYWVFTNLGTHLQSINCTLVWSSRSRFLLHFNVYPTIFRSIARLGMGKGDLEKAVPAGEHEVRPISSIIPEHHEPEPK